jgi:hypothetical protein
MRGFRLNGWQRIGIVLSVLWAVGVSQWFLRHLPRADDIGIASVYLQCISEPEANRGVCQNRVEWFSKEARSEFRTAWSSMVIVPIVVLWALICVAVWTVRLIKRGFQPST